MIFLLSDENPTLPLSDIAEKISTIASGLDVRAVKGAEGAGQTALLEIAGKLYSIILMDEPLARHDFAAEIEMAAHWRLASPIFEMHKSHIVVAALGSPEGYEGVVAAFKAVTLIAGALAKLLPVSSFVFASSRVFAPISRLNTAFDSLVTRGDLPDDVWVSINFNRLSNGKLRMYSFGLCDFVGFEFEAEMTKVEAEKLVSKYIGLRKYLVMKGSVLRQGDTVGISENERLQVRFKKSVTPKGIPTMSLVAEKTM